MSEFQHVPAPKPVSCFFIKLLFTVGRRLWFHFEYKRVTTGKKEKKSFLKSLSQVAQGLVRSSCAQHVPNSLAGKEGTSDPTGQEADCVSLD